MKWEKKGFICSCESFDLPWYKKNTMVPLPYLIDAKTLRIFVTMCDEQNIGRIGYVDVNPENPSEILNYSKTPILDIGFDGTFDDNGMVTASLLEDGDKLYMYYSGYQLCVKVPYLIFTGLAVSNDNGLTFEKLTTEVPVLDRVKEETASRCVPFVIKEDDIYKMWYTASLDECWIDSPRKKEPLYNLKYQTSKTPIYWEPKAGKTVIDFNDQNPDEHGICKPMLWKEDNKYKIIYSIRSLSKGYRLGYAESENGVDWVRMDEKIGLDVSENGWDSEMVCFSERICIKDKTYLFYCGNHYGMAGMGYAELIEK